MRIFVLSGAGISAQSGLGTFRGQGGLWKHLDPVKLATPKAFTRDPAAVHAFYNARRRALLDATPNAAHAALARLETVLPAPHTLTLVTQNVDDLHERAGSRCVLHMHGELLKARCLACGTSMAWRSDLGGEACLACGAQGRLRPDVVWFGEMPLYMPEIEAALAAADLFVAIGTSGAVYPAAGFVRKVQATGTRTCELNLEPSDNAWAFDETHYGPATDIVPAWVEALLSTVDRPAG